ncbi:MAG: hypothetical protein V3V20_10330, partial [Algisphaera sp.]
MLPVNWSTNNGNAPAAGTASHMTIFGGSGTYTFTADGTGEIQIQLIEAKNPATFSNSSGSPSGARSFSFGGGSGQSHTFTLNVANNSVNSPGTLTYVTVIQNAGDLRNLQLINDARSGTFDHKYTDDLGTYSTLRFMNWQQANGNPIHTWSQRTLTNEPQGHEPQNRASQLNGDPYTKAGVALEYMVEMANQLNQNAWFSIPAEVDDNYITEFATYVKNNLNSNLKVFVEYSNETWNPLFQFTQYDHVVKQGRAMGWGDPTVSDADYRNDTLAGHQYVAHRSAQIWKIFADVLGDDDANPTANSSTNRLIKVLAGQSANIHTAEARLNALKNPDINPDGIMPDTLATAPYFTPFDLIDRHYTGEWWPTNDRALTQNFLDMSFEQRVQTVLADVQSNLTSHVTPEVESHEALAAANNLWFTAYEGGQHLTAAGRDGEFQEMIDVLVEVNRRSEMYNIYNDYLDLLETKGVSLYANFTDTGSPTRYGSWGVMEHQNQSANTAHKFRATEDWVTNHTPSNLAPIARAGGINGHISTIADSNGSALFSFDGSFSSDLDGTLNSNGYQWKQLIGGSDVVVSNSAKFAQTLSVGTHTFELRVTDNHGTTDTHVLNVVVAPYGSDGTLSQSNFSGNSLGFQNESGIASVNITQGSGLEPHANDNGLVFSANTNSGIDGTRSPFDANGYLSIKATPQSGNTANYSGAKIKFEVKRLAWSSHNQFALKSSFDNFSTTLGTHTISPGTVGSPSELEFNLPSNYDSDHEVEFRLYVYGAQWGAPATGEFELAHASVLTSVTLHGSVDTSTTTGTATTLGAINYGIAATDNATGTGYILFSETDVHQRFFQNAPHTSNSDHLITIVEQGGQWFYDNNHFLTAFTPTSSDVLLAAVDFSNDTITSLQGQTGFIAGIEQCYGSGDLSFHANRWNNGTNLGEFTVNGAQFVRSNVTLPAGPTALGTINYGIAATDNATGTGYILFSETDVHQRFFQNAPHTSNS